MCMGGGDGGAGAARQAQIDQQKSIADATDKINQVFGGYDDAFYKKRTQAYEDYAMPQLQNQFAQTQKKSLFGLADQGLWNSSAARNTNQQLQLANSQNEQNIANTALGQSNDLRKQIASQQQSLIGQANVASDPLSVAGQAALTAGSFAAPSAFAPIGDLFGTFANSYLTKQNSNLYGQAAQQYQQPINYGSSLPKAVQYSG